MAFSFGNRVKEIPVFTSRSEAFDYMMSYLVRDGKDMMEAAEQASKFADIIATNKKLPDTPPKQLSGLDQGIAYVKQLASLKKENPEVWDMVTGALGGVIGGFTGGGSVSIEEPTQAVIDFDNLE
jgi:hypothetical protein